MFSARRQWESKMIVVSQLIVYRDSGRVPTALRKPSCKLYASGIRRIAYNLARDICTYPHTRIDFSQGGKPSLETRHTVSVARALCNNHQIHTYPRLSHITNNRTCLLNIITIIWVAEREEQLVIAAKLTVGSFADVSVNGR